MDSSLVVAGLVFSLATGIHAGGVAGLIVGMRTGISLGFKQCGSSCRDEGALMLLSFIGIPLGSGVLGYHAGRHTVEVVEYRAGGTADSASRS